MEKVVIAGKPGWIVIFDPAAGTTTGTIDLGQPISSSPIVKDGMLLVPGTEGVIYRTPVPVN